MAIHQIQVRYDSTADRLLLKLRTHSAEHYAVWLTRRMTARLFPPFHDAVLRAGVAQATPQAMAVPEARQMLEQAALQRPLPGANFDEPFAEADCSFPLGPDPLLPDAIDLRPGSGGQITIALRETRGRRLEMQLTGELSTALLRLMTGALQVSDWGLSIPLAAPAATTATAGALLN
jgi:hypothetical protein